MAMTIRVYQDGDSFWEFVFHQLTDMKKLEDWSYSTLDKTEIINETKHTAHVLVEFSRRDSLGKSLWSCRRDLSLNSKKMVTGDYKQDQFFQNLENKLFSWSKFVFIKKLINHHHLIT